MTVLKLVNNSWDESTRNLCFVNTSLQLLYSLPEVRSFFVNQHYKINQDQSANFKICNEVSRIFKSAGHFSISAATLRLIVGCESQNEEICNGSQQDITLFIRLLLQEIEKELTELDGPHALFINKFWGSEHVIRKFVNTSDGTCSRCGKLPRSENEDFNMLKLESVNTNQSIPLSTMIQNSFLEGTEIFKMKCSECCPHQGVCPLTGNCQPKNAVDHRLVNRTPDFLFIHLLRFSNFSDLKTKTRVVPEEILTLPNGDTFKLISIADHLGDLIRNGHYVSSVKTEQGWMICDDEKQYIIKEPVSSNNYVFLYFKIHPDKKLSIPEKTNENKSIFRRDDAISECPNCYKKIESLQSHHENSFICKQVFGLKMCKVNLPRIEINKYTPTKKTNCETIKIAPSPSVIVCHTCKAKVTNLEQHFKMSLICKQSRHKHSLHNNFSNNQTKKCEMTNTDKRASLNQIPKKQKCKSCLRFFPSINQHLSRYFSCQNAYGIDGILNKSFETDESTNPFNSPSGILKRNLEEDKSVVTEACRFCNKKLKNILIHLKKSKQCQSSYDMKELEMEKKRKRNEKVARYRARMTSPEKVEEKAAKVKRMAGLRARMTSPEKVKEKAAKVKQMAGLRARMTSPEKVEEKAAKVKRMAGLRARMTSPEKVEEKAAKVKQMAGLRARMTSPEKEEERTKDATNECYKRARMTSPEKVEEKAAKVKRMAGLRAKMTSLEKKENNEADAKRKKRSREEIYKNAQRRRRVFLDSVKYGPIFACVCCNRLCFQNGVVELSSNFEQNLEEVYPGLFAKTIGNVENVPSTRGKHFICSTCKNHIYNGNVPPMSHKNNLEVFEFEKYPELLLTELESCMIARTLLFMKIFKLPKSRWSAVKDKLVNVPIHENDIQNTLKALPRTPKQAGILPIKLKRKKEYKNVHMEEYIDVNKIKTALRTLKVLGHKYYQFIREKDLDNFENRCKDTDTEGFDFINGFKDQIEDEGDNECPKEDDDRNDEDMEKEMLTKDSVSKFQFDYNQNTCFSNDVPELVVCEKASENVSIAPGEGKIPTSILQDDEWDMKSHPHLDPLGENNLNCKRKIKLTAQQFFEQRILNVNKQFANTASFVFAAVQYVENKQLTNNINISFQRGKAKKGTGGGLKYTLQDPYSVLDNISNTPRYWKKRKNELIAKLENLGPFHLFFTLSCADKRYEENFTALLQDQNITYELRDGKEHCLINGMDIDSYLKQNQSKHDFIRQNVLTATRNFNYRVKSFIKNIIMSEMSDMCAKFYNYRVEFQMRGAGHIHGVIWVDLDKFEERHFMNDKENKGSNPPVLRKAFQYVNEDNNPEDEPLYKEALVKFADTLITCSLKNPQVRKVVEEVNSHHHTKKCKKESKKCKYNFRKLPAVRTVIAVPSRIKFKDPDERAEMEEKCKIVLNKVKNVLDDDDSYNSLLEEIGSDLTSEKELNEYLTNKDVYERSKSIIDDLIFAEQIKNPNNDSFADLETKRQQMLGKQMYENLKELNSQSFENSKESTLEERRKNNIYKLLKKAEIDTFLQIKDKNELLKVYEDLLKISFRGFYFVHKRDVDEVNINNYNEEWMKCWDSNMDIQITMDYFAVITYITDYYLKDDTGTLEFIQKALKDSENTDLRSKLKLVKNTFLTHRQMGEAESYYRLLPNLHLSDSNISCEFVSTGREKSRFLHKINEDELYKQNPNKIVEIEGKEGTYYIEKSSILDRYYRKPQKLDNISFSQFVKRTIKGHCKKRDITDEPQSVEISQDIENDFIIALDPEKRIPIPNCFTLIADNPDSEGEEMKLRKPIVLRFHKFKQSSEPHDFYYSELLLYYPHNCHDDLFPDDLDKCKELYENNLKEINYVKSIVMPHLERVEEGQEKAAEIVKEEMGNLLDPQKEQDDEDCKEEGVEEPKDFITLDPDMIVPESGNNDSLYKRVELDDVDLLMEQTRPLDDDQRLVLDSIVDYAKSLKKSAASKSNYPNAPRIIVQGGAGSGKSFIINLAAKWIETILRSPGDHPDHPYILKCAFSGTAAANIEGQTLHSAFDFKFGSKFMSLDDKKRDLRRTTLYNLKVLIIDEFSMVPVDMLYMLDLRLKEIKEKPDLPFGGVAVYMFGDLLQLPPVMARFPFQEPRQDNFKLAHVLDPLWKTFDVIMLTHNHRQGEDKIFADILNRIRVGQQTDEDVKILSSRVLPRNDPSIPGNSLYIFATNDKVNKMNTFCLQQIDADEFVSYAKVVHKTLKNYDPKTNNDGSIPDTGLQKKLTIKIGAKVMLTVNLRTSDGLTNGAFGQILGYQLNSNNFPKTIHIQFYNEKVGKETRKEHPDIQSLYPGKLVTPIEMYEKNFNIGNKFSSTSSSATAQQFPLKLAFAVTAHKVQGQTIKKPMNVVIDLYKANKEAQAYVMLSRSESMDQMIILDGLYDESWNVSLAAQTEVHSMNQRALNRRPKDQYDLEIVSLNIRSLRKHYIDIINDPFIKNVDVICLQETWLEEYENTSLYEIPGFQSHFNDLGRGKGLASYCKKCNGFQDVKNNNFQISKLILEQCEIISLYRSQEEKGEIVQYVSKMISVETPTIILGDMNLNLLKENSHPIIKYFKEMSFSQHVQSATHQKGGMIDLVFASPHFIQHIISVHQISNYYSDHDRLHVRIKFKS